MVSRRAQGSHCSSLTGWLLRLFGRLSLILFVPIANAGYNLQSNGVTLTQDASDTTSPYNYTITFTINNVTGGKTQNDGIESLQLTLDDGNSYCYSGIAIAPANVNTSTPYGDYNATAFTNGSSDASLPAGSYSSIQLALFTDDNCGARETFVNNLAITITAPNSPPVAVDDTGAVDENSTLNVAASGLLGNDTDADADALSITAIRTGTEAGSGSAGTLSSSLTGTYGDLTLNADGSYSYNANNSESLSAGTTTTDTFTYTISDGAASDTGQLVITITGTNDAPVAVADAGAVNEDATLDVAASGVLGNDTDVDSNDTLAVSAIRTGSETGSGTSGSLGSALTGAYGDVTMNADGSYAYIANNAAALAAGAQVTDTFTYTVTDGNITDTAEIVITITGTNDPPFATDDASAVDEDDTLSVAATGLLANDTDADAGASLSITAIRTGAESGSGTAGSIGVALAGAYGDFTVNADGSYSYNANNANALAAGTTATDTFTYTVSDGTITDTAEIVITVTGVNDPPVVSDAGATLAYTEGDSATVIDGTLTITDVDDTNMEGATITISSGYQSSEDVLAFTNANGITGSWDSSGGVLTLSGSASKANYETAFESITYQNTNTDDPDNTDRTVTWVVNDGSSNSAGVTSTITVADANDAPVVSDAGATLAYTEGDSATVIDGTLTITDVDDTNMEGATITISSGYQSSEDVLAFTNANGITGSWDSVNGVLTLSGSASKANYETAFESITYQNTNTDDPDNTDRTVTWVVNDGTSNSSGVTSTITVADVNDAPVVSDAGGTSSFSAGSSATVIDGSLTITDVDDTNMEGATITISSGYQASEDVLALGNTGLGISVESNSGGVLTLTGSTTKANYETALESVTYQNTDAGSPNTSDRIVTWLVNDGDADSAAGVTSTISVSAPSLHHYAVSYDGGSTTNNANGPNCTAVPVTIIAHNAGHTAVTTSNTVTLTTSSGNGAWVSNSDNTSIAIGFGGANSITTYLRHVVAGATTINVTDGSQSESEDPTFTFNAATMSLEFFLDANGDGTPDGTGDDIPTLTAGTTLDQILVGVKDGGNACTQDAAVQGQTISTNLAYECINPSLCRRDKDMSVTPTGGSATGIEDNNSGATIAYQSVDLVFNANGYAPIPLIYKDVGSTKLYGAMTTPASGNNPPLAVTGTSNTFVSKPADLSVSVASNPGTTSSGSGFIAAGTNFNVGVQALNALGGTTPNFGQESPAETVKVTFVALTYPTGGSNAGTLSSGSYSLSGSTDGAGTVVANFNEAGTITLRAEIGDGDYLGVGNVIGTTSGDIGRFYPSEFELTNNAGGSPAVLDGCASSGFTYFDESAIDIDYKITAKNALGDAISNYDAASGYGVATVSIGVESTADDGVDLASRLSGATSSWSSGVYSVDSSSSRFESSGSSPNAELLANVGVIISDSLDGLNLAGLDFDPGEAGDCTGSCTGQILPSSLRLRHGRLRLAGASGPETVDLPATLETQYYNGSAWIRNTLDDCTSFPELIQFGGAALTAGVTVGSGTSAASYTSLASSTVTLVDGTSGLIFSAPGIGNTGSFQIDFNGLSGLDHLQYDWNGGGKEFPSPATITFGSFRGHDKIIGRGASGAQE